MYLLLITITVDNCGARKNFYLRPKKVFVAVRFNSRQRFFRYLKPKFDVDEYVIEYCVYTCPYKYEKMSLLK